MTWGKINVGSASISTSNVTKGDIDCPLIHTLWAERKRFKCHFGYQNGRAKLSGTTNIDNSARISGAAIRTKKVT